MFFWGADVYGSVSRDDHPIRQLTAFAILGAGFVVMFLGVEWFWLIWVLGFAVFLPALSVVADYYSDDDTDEKRATEDPLDELRERYASGELTEAEFERKVERLLETEDRDTARELRVRSNESTSVDVEREYET